MVNKTKTVEFIRFFNPKTHKLIFKMPTINSSSILLDSEIRQSVPFSVYSEIWQNDNSFKTIEQALEYCDNDLNKYELMRIIPQYFGKYFQEEPKERGI